ncbi:MAG: hypothetical protein ACT4PT_06250 [Methanobacteriota archaeon]
MTGLPMGFAAESGEYLNEEDGNVYWYDAEANTLTYLYPNGGESFGPESGGCDPEASSCEGECAFSAAEWWFTTTLYVDTGACAKAGGTFNAGAGTFTARYRDEVRLVIPSGVSTVKYTYQWDWCVRNSTGHDIDCGTAHEEDLECIGTGLVASCTFGPYETAPIEVVSGGVRVCTKNVLKEEGVAKRWTAWICT